MGKLQCEICGSTSLLKQESYVVCQSCGISYTVDEAQALLSNTIHSKDCCSGTPVSLSGASVSNLFSLAYLLYGAIPDSEKPKFATRLRGVMTDIANQQIKTAFSQIIDISVCEKTVVCAHDTFIDCWNALLEMCKNISISSDDTQSLLRAFDNRFISMAENVLVDAWQDIVTVDYYQGSYKDNTWEDDQYRPDMDAFNAFIDQGDSLIRLMTFCIEQFNEDTILEDKKAAYTNIVVLERALVSAEAFERSVRELTDPDGNVMEEFEYWRTCSVLSDTAKESRLQTIEMCEQHVQDLLDEISARDEAIRQKSVQEYWLSHPSEKQDLEQERDDLLVQISRLESDSDHIDELDEYAHMEDVLQELEHEKTKVSRMHIKQRKDIQEHIDEAQAVYNELNAAIVSKLEIIADEITVLESRVKDIDTILATKIAE